MINNSELIWARVDRASSQTGCWLWTGELNANGYGRFMLLGVRYMAHRWSYEQVSGVIPEGLQLDHLCRVRNCVNPRHLEIVTPRENILRCDRVRATHCKNGHERSRANVGVDGRGRKFCRACKSIRGKLRRKKWQNAA